MTTLLIATRNAHKVGEIRAILGAQFRFLTLNEFPAAPKVVEDADTFAGNATKKAVELARWLAAEHPTSNIQHSTSEFRSGGRFRPGSGRAERRARRAFRAVRRAGQKRKFPRRRQQRQVAAPAERRAAGKTHGAIPLRHRARPVPPGKSKPRRRSVMPTNLRRGFSTARAKDGFISAARAGRLRLRPAVRAGWFRAVRSPNWARM